MAYRIHTPTTMEEAGRLEIDLHHALFIAGGTDLVVQMSRGERQPDHLIDISRLPDLTGIRSTGDQIEIGALTIHRQLEIEPLLAGSVVAIQEAARQVGGRQIRNLATIGGNIANGSPAADVVPPLIALDATVHLTGPMRERSMPLGDFYLGPRQTARHIGEVLTSVRLKLPSEDTATVFLKAGRRKAMEIAVVNVAALISLNPDGSCRKIRIVLGSVGPTAFRARTAETVLSGANLSPEALQEAAKAAAEECAPISDVRASAAYRRLLVEALVERALVTCLQRIGQGGTFSARSAALAGSSPQLSERSY